MNDIFRFRQPAAVFLISTRKRFRENQRNVELERAAVSVSPANTE